jgi:hypothetical protein
LGRIEEEGGEKVVPFRGQNVPNDAGVEAIGPANQGNHRNCGLFGWLRIVLYLYK